MSEIIQNRIEKLRKSIRDSRSAILITDEINVGFFSGFNRSEGAYLLTQDKSYLLVDFRYYEAALSKAVSCDVICFKNFTCDISDILLKCEINSLFTESNNLTVSTFNRYKRAFEAKKITLICDDSIDKAVADIRIIKDETEFDKILTAQKIAEKSYLEVLNYLKVGVREREIALELEYLMKKNGAENVSFDLITISGSKTSLPHGVPSDNSVQKGDFFTFDFGAVYDGYHSDTTRTVAIGEPSDEQRKVYDIVLKAQLAVLENIKAGLLCSDADKIARDIISAEGYGEFFGHSTGHGVGLEIHEAPTVSSKSKTILQQGMVVTDEPGIYLPKKFGVRIEDMIYITQTGYENFVTLPKELIVL